MSFTKTGKRLAAQMDGVVRASERKRKAERAARACGDCGATRVEMYMTSTPSCVSREACALRVQLRDLRAAVLLVAAEMDMSGKGSRPWRAKEVWDAAVELRKACKVLR